MKITKEQIQLIDKRLEIGGVKYWDLRIEMIDHIVSDIELNAKSNNFKSELTLSLKRIGWLGNLKDVNKKGWQNVNRGYRQIYFKGFVDFFKKRKNILLFISLFSIYIFTSQIIQHKVFIKISYAIFMLPILWFFYESYLVWRKKLGKSIHKDYGINYMFLSFLILNAIMQFIRIKDGLPIEYHKPILFLIVPLHLVLTYSGYKVYKKAIVKAEKMRMDLM